MEDKRIVKTKRNIKDTFIQLIGEKPFEKINVSEICREAMISRITFYTYYDSKYALVDEMFTDYTCEAQKYYHLLQGKNNFPEDGLTGYENMMESILTLYYNHYDFFSHTTATENPYLFSEFFNHVFFSVSRHIEQEKMLVPQYPSKLMSTLICNGLFGVINACTSEKMSENRVRSIVQPMFRDILLSGLFESER